MRWSRGSLARHGGCARGRAGTAARRPAHRRPDRRRASPPTPASPTSAARTGVWTKNPAAEKASHIQHYVADPEVRRRAWQRRIEARAPCAPNAGHRALVELERTGRAAHASSPRTSTGCTRRPGSTPTSSSRSTARCARRRAWRAATGGRWATPSTGCGPARTTRPAERCGGILKSATISSARTCVARGPRSGPDAAAGGCDVLLAVGTTLARLPGGRRRAHRAGERARASSSSTASRRRSTTSPTSSSAARSARCCPRCVGGNAPIRWRDC